LIASPCHLKNIGLKVVPSRTRSRIPILRAPERDGEGAIPVVTCPGPPNRPQPWSSDRPLPSSSHRSSSACSSRAPPAHRHTLPTYPTCHSPIAALRPPIPHTAPPELPLPRGSLGLAGSRSGRRARTTDMGWWEGSRGLGKEMRNLLE
jgi:hypothetical protein